MTKLSILGWCYAAFCGLTCGWFCAAAIGGWPGPQIDMVDSQGNSYSGSSRSGYSSGRSGGGSWGGGK